MLVLEIGNGSILANEWNSVKLDEWGLDSMAKFR